MTILYSQTIQNTSLSQGQRQLRAWEFVATASGVVNSAKVWVNSAGKTFRIELWSDNGGNVSTKRPLNLLASQTYTALTTGQHTITFASPATLVSGTRYWVSFVTQETGNWTGADSAVAPLRVTGNTLSLFTDPSPNPWVSTNAANTAGLPYLILESNETSISGIDPLVSGQTATVTLTDGALVPNQINITGGGVTKTAALVATGTPFQYSFTVPMPVDGQTMLSIGAVTSTVTNGVVTTVPANTTYSIRSAQPDDLTQRDFSSVTFTTIDAVNNVGTLLGWTPALKTNGQAAFDTTRAIINNDGTVDFQDYTGTSIFYFRDPDDFICRTWTVETVDGVATTPPTMPTDTSVSIAEGETGIGVFTASAGTQPITYSLTGADAALFTVNSSTASVSKLTPVVFGQTYNITVVATNSFGSDSQNITITVTKVVSGDSNVTFKGGRLKAKESIATFRAKLPFQAQSVAADITALRTDFNSLLTKMTTAGWFEGGDEQLTMIKIALQCGLPQLVKRLKEQAPSQMPVQSASVASDVAALRTDFNALLTKLKDSNLMATS